MMESVLGFIILKFILWIFPSRKIEDVSQFIEALPLRGKQLEPYRDFIADDIVSSLGAPSAVFLAAGAVIEVLIRKL